MKTLWTYFLLVSLLIAACGDPEFEYRCQENSTQRECLPKEIAMINGIRSMVKDIHDFRLTQLTDNAIILGHKTRIKVSRILLFSKLKNAQINTLGTMNALLGPQDILFLDTKERALTAHSNCLANLLFEAYISKVLKKNSALKDEQLKDFFNNYETIYRNTEKSYNFSSLNLQHLSCHYLEEPPLDFASLSKSNQQLAMEIKNSLLKYNKVAIFAGNHRVPLSDLSRSYIINKLSKNHPEGWDTFYKMVDQERKLPSNKRSFILESSTGATFPIQKYLDESGQNYIEILFTK